MDQRDSGSWRESKYAKETLESIVYFRTITRPIHLLSLLMPFLPSLALALPAFPGAAGFGSEATGGSVRAGAGNSQIIKVTNLNDSGTGSLRACVNAAGPRICVFEVGGYISLASPLVISNGNITIAGQTAPAPGIHIRNNGNKNSTVQTRADNIIMQHIGIRAGDDGCTVGSCDQRRALELYGGSNMIFDHLSLTWGIDETFDTYGGTAPTNFTIANTLIGENLRHSFHSKNRTSADGHAYGTMFNTLSSSGVKATFVGNLLTMSYYRNPLLKSGWNLEFLNNVVYGWGSGSSDTLYQEGSNNLIFAGNYYKKASWSANSSCLVGNGGKVYAPAGSNACPSGVGGSGVPSPAFPGSNAVDGYNANPNDTLTEVFGSVGMRPWDRYSADQRMVTEAKNGTGGYKDCVNQCGQGYTNVPVDPSAQWPALPATTRVLSVPRNPNDILPSGYSVVEDWLFDFSNGGGSTSTPVPTATATPIIPTATPINRTATPVNPTATPVSPAATPTVAPTGSGVSEMKLRSVAAEDGYIVESSQGSGVGGTMNASGTGISAVRLGDDSSNRVVKGIISFNTSMLPVDAKIVSASLDFSVSGTNRTTSQFAPLYAHMKNGSFGTGARLESADYQSASSLTRAAQLTATRVDHYSGTLTSTALGLINRTGRTQFRLSFVTATDSNSLNNWLVLNGGEATDVSLRPTLTVRYTSGQRLMATLSRAEIRLLRRWISRQSAAQRSKYRMPLRLRGRITRKMLAEFTKSLRLK